MQGHRCIDERLGAPENHVSTLLVFSEKAVLQRRLIDGCHCYIE